MEVSPLKIDKGQDRAEIYPLLYQQAKALIEGESDVIANLGNIAALIKETFDFHWVGFYRLKGDTLILGPFQGPVACTRIVVPKGVCGQCVTLKKTIVVPNVHEFEGHIACSALSNSEIVLPFIQDGKVKFILDIDSIHLDDFSEVDKLWLDKVIQLGHTFIC